MAILKALARTKYSVRQNRYLPVIRYISSLGLCVERGVNAFQIKFINKHGCYSLVSRLKLGVELQRLIEGKVL